MLISMPTMMMMQPMKMMVAMMMVMMMSNRCMGGRVPPTRAATGQLEEDTQPGCNPILVFCDDSN